MLNPGSEECLLEGTTTFGRMAEVRGPMDDPDFPGCVYLATVGDTDCWFKTMDDVLAYLSSL